MVHWLEFEQLGGIAYHDFWGYVYFSATTYSSLGIGDIVPYGAMRFITAVQVLNGLVLIGWSVSVTYFSVQKLWDMHELGKAK
jgi:Co/Zn/Cd efflux system component